MGQRHEVADTLRGTWGAWIGGQHWDLFVTLTSEKQTHPEAMLKRFRYCMNKASDHVYGRSRKPDATRAQWVVGLERTKQGWPHSHAVVRFPGCDLTGPAGRAIFDLGYWQRWMTDTGGFAWLELPDSQQAVVQYVTKYVVKDGELELSAQVEFARQAGQQLHLDTARRGQAHTAAQKGPRGRLGPSASEGALSGATGWSPIDTVLR